MAEVRCLMCNKLNPADAEFCRYCKSPLKAQDAGSVPGEEGQGSGESPDWLSRIRDRARRETPDSSDLFGKEPSGSDETDWLSSLKDSESEGEAEPAPGEDWLARLGGDTSPTTSGETVGETGEEAIDLSAWLNNLDPEPGAPTAPDVPAADLPAVNPPASHRPDPEPLAADQIAWSDLERFSETEPSPESPAAGDTLDWLRGFNDFDAESPPAAQPAGKSEPGSEFDAGSFFASLESQPGESQPATPETDFSSLSFNTSTDLPDLTAGAGSEESLEEDQDDQPEDLPDWLRGLSGGEPQPGTPETPGRPQDSTPAWLNAAAATEPGAGAEMDETQDLPDWLRGQAEQPGTLAAFEGEETAAPAESLPGWLSAFDEPDAPQGAAPETAQTPEPAVPDWLAGVGTGFAAATAAQVPSEEEEPVAAAPADLPLAAEPVAETPPFTEDSLPEWLGAFKQEEPEGLAENELTPVAAQPADASPFDMDLPEWLDEEGARPEAPAQPEGALETTARADSEELAEAELPSWVQAMRPVESALSGEVAQAENDQRVEKAGPLAGMRGVLPAEDSVIQYIKPPVYSVKLRQTEKQRGQSALLDSVLARETQTRALPAAPSSAPWMIQRVLVALFLLVALTAMVMLNTRFFEVPVFGPAAIESMYREVDSLQAGDPVLLAVDYEPAFSGEMRFAAIQVIDHLMRKGARFAIVSTVPTGPALAEDLLAAAEVQNPGFLTAETVVNLGYLPGGTISLLEFARNPALAAPGERTGTWASSPVLRAVAPDGAANLQNFRQVIVLTDRAEIGRAWVEQVQPSLGEVPLLVVSSAQAGPLLEPFVNSRQIQGLVSGLSGGTLYGQWAGRNDANSAPLRYWGAYQAGLLIAFVLVLLGGLFSGITGARIESRKEPARRPTQTPPPPQKEKA